MSWKETNLIFTERFEAELHAQKRQNLAIGRVLLNSNQETKKHDSSLSSSSLLLLIEVLLIKSI